MRDERFRPNCGPSGYCGSCTTPCFLDDRAAFESLVERGPDPYDELAHSVEDTDTFALNCVRWEDPEGVCSTEVCISNYFCYDDYQADAEGDAV